MTGKDSEQSGLVSSCDFSSYVVSSVVVGSCGNRVSRLPPSAPVTQTRQRRLRSSLPFSRIAAPPPKKNGGFSCNPPKTWYNQGAWGISLCPSTGLEVFCPGRQDLFYKNINPLTGAPDLFRRSLTLFFASLAREACHRRRALLRAADLTTCRFACFSLASFRPKR